MPTVPGGVRQPRTHATTAQAAQKTHTDSKPCAASSFSPANGPMASPAYNATEKYEAASPRRSSGAMSCTAVAAPTKTAASPIPVTRRSATSAARLVARL